jgi:hypothetical protein
MAKFDVEVYRTICLNFFIEADTKEEAERIAKEQEQGWTDLNTWKEYPSERGYHTQELKIDENHCGAAL